MDGVDIGDDIDAAEKKKHRSGILTGRQATSMTLANLQNQIGETGPLRL